MSNFPKIFYYVLNGATSRSVSLYLYNRSQILQVLSILDKWTLQEELQIVWLIMCLEEKVKTQQQQKKISNIKTLAGAWNWTRDILHTKRMLYHCTTESTESMYCSQAIDCLDAMDRTTHFQQTHFFCNIFTCMYYYIWQFLIFTGVGFTV